MIDIGSKINGRYKVIGNIGSGGMANVFLAHDLILDRDVAVKVLRFDFQDDKSAIRRFQREALAASELVHPNIVGVYDVGEEDGRQYLVMEYVKGTDLKKFITTQYPVPFENIVLIMRQILSAISLAHQHRIIHRDLKPQNILMDEAGNVKIADFGIAIALSETSLTQTNTLLGSVHYLSPEQARGSMATRQSDIYALGIILFELLMGNVPFEGESAVSIALKHFQSEIPSVREANPTIPQALENVVLHATAKEATDRYTSADEMAEDIATALSPERIGEPRYEPQSMLEETKVLTPLTDSDMPEEFKQMQTVDQEPIITKPDENKPKKKKKKKKKKPDHKKKIFAGIGIALVAIILFLAFARPKVNVPDVTGMTVAEARQKIEESKLKVNPEEKEIASEEVDKGKIVKTSPSLDSRVKKNTEVTLYVSSGSENIILEDYSDKKYETVESQLIELGFKKRNITKETVENDEVAKGMIVSQSINAGEKVNPKETKITLTVSKGSEKIVLRSLDGYRKPDVQTYFEEVGLVLYESYEYSNTVSEGMVISQNPSANSRLDKNSTVTVIFSRGPEPVASSSAPVTPPSSSSESKPSSSKPSSSEPSSSQPPVVDSSAQTNSGEQK